MNAESGNKKLTECTVAELKSIKEQAEKQIEKLILSESKEMMDQFVRHVADKKVPFLDIIRALRGSNAIYESLGADGKDQNVYFNPKNPLDFYNSSSGRKPKWFSQLEKEHEDLSPYLLNNLIN